MTQSHTSHRLPSLHGFARTIDPTFDCSVPSQVGLPNTSQNFPLFAPRDFLDHDQKPVRHTRQPRSDVSRASDSSTMREVFGFGDPNIYQPRAPANPRLLKALATSHDSEDQAQRTNLYEALLNSVLIVPTCDPARKTVLLVEDEKGQPALCTFTDMAALLRWQPTGQTFLSLPTPQLLREGFPTTAAGLWINIADRNSRFVSRVELARVTGGLILPTYVSQVERDLTPVHADFEPRQPGTLPTLLVGRIVEAITREADVTQVFLMELEAPPKPKRLCVGLRLGRVLEDAAVDALLRRVARSINRDASRRRAIDVLVLDFNRYRIVSAMMPAIWERN